jgi:hypothetical protein
MERSVIELAFLCGIAPVRHGMARETSAPGPSAASLKSSWISFAAWNGSSMHSWKMGNSRRSCDG